MKKEKFTLFWGGEFSQWYPSVIEYDTGMIFNCAEQAMMWDKATLFNDTEIADQIMDTSNPSKQKALGRKVSRFDKKYWRKYAREIVYKINKHKFIQNPELMQVLLDTEGTTIVEASPFDKIWGIGLGVDHPDATDRTKWLGTNWLGQVLTDLRNNTINNTKVL